MQNSPDLKTAAPSSSRGSLWKIVFLVVGVAVATSILTVWLTTRYLFPKEFTPVTLNAAEQKALDAKIGRIDPVTRAKTTAAGSNDAGLKPVETLDPEAYSEEDVSREVTFSERELNALLANNPGLASKLAIDLSENLASAKLLIPLDPDLPLFGGKTLKVTAGLELRFAENRPVVALRGISLWGVPIPSAWLGGIKNLDLVQEFGSQDGFWRAFAAGLEDIRVEEEKLTVIFRQ